MGIDVMEGAPPIETILRKWAQAYRDHPEYRFPSDPNAEFFPADLDNAAAEIEKLRRHVAEWRAFAKAVIHGHQ